MKKPLTRIKAILTTLWITLISFFSKVIGQFGDTIDGWANPTHAYEMQAAYGVLQPESKIDIAMRIFPRLLIPVTLAFGIISFLKIRKIDDEVLKKKKTKKAIIVITILIIIILLLFVWLAIGIKKINFSVSFGNI